MNRSVKSVKSVKSNKSNRSNKSIGSNVNRSSSSQLVLDPITGNNIVANDTTKDEYDHVISQLGSSDTFYNSSQLLSRAFPPPHNVQSFLRSNSHMFIKEFGIFAFIVAILPLPPPFIIILAAIIIYRVWLVIDNEADKLVFDSERQRAVQSESSLGGLEESANWLNRIISRIWGIINPDLFTLGIDLLEDVMESMVPSFAFINGVKVSDMDQGNQPMRILALKDLSDDDMFNSLNNKSEISLNSSEHHEKVRPEEEIGEYVNLEIKFAYRAKPSQGDIAAKSRNIHLLVHFYLGLKKLMGVGLPVYVEVEGIVGTLRARVQLIPDPPFIKNTTITFIGLPKVVISATPLTKHFLNAMKLPLISQFINSSINETMSEFCAPKSYTIDMQDLLLEDDVKRDTSSIGLIAIRIHGAENLEKSDSTGSSDPYCTIAYSKQGKPLYSTRVIVNDLNPIWEEGTTILLRPEIIKSQEDISVILYDSDRFSADDRLGQASMSIEKLVRNPQKVYRLRSELSGHVHGTKREGYLSWSVSFHPKRDLNKSLMTNGLHPSVPEDIAEQYKDEFGDNHGLKDSRLVQRIKPEPNFPSGILSMQIHSISQLEVKNVSGTYGSDAMRSGAAGQNYIEAENEESSEAPSSYCTIIVNDQTIYKTRKKPFSFTPVFNAGTEKFIADWRSTMLCVVVYDARYRETDPILGVVPLKVSELFKNGCQLTNSYPLIGGLGYGRIRLSVLFRSCDIKLEKPLLGWEIGTMQLHSNLKVIFNENEKIQNYSKCVISTISSNVRLKSRKNVSENEIEWKVETDEPPMRLPVKRRYASYFRIELYQNSHKLSAVAIIWLRDIVDNEMLRKFKMSLWSGKDFHRLIQCYTYDEKDVEALGLRKIGYVELDMRYKSGLGKTHNAFSGNKEAKDVMAAWDAAVSSGQRSTVGDFINEYTKVDKDRDPANKVRRFSEDEFSHQPSTIQTEFEDEYVTDEGEDFNPSSSKQSENSKKATRRALHREHRGAYQFKPVRTAAWVASGFKTGFTSVKDKTSLVNRRTDNIETEV